MKKHNGEKLYRESLLQDVSSLIGIEQKNSLALSKAQVAQIWEMISKERVEALWIDLPTSHFRKKIFTFLSVEEFNSALPFPKMVLVLIIDLLLEVGE